jgi:hypothetical protein
VTALLLANLCATLFMTGVAWFVQVVHYPLFDLVGREAFGTYHERHSTLTTRVVLVPMTVELLTSAALLIERPQGVGPSAVWTGLALAAATWASTALVQVPQHRELDHTRVRRLVAQNWPRTAAWTAHAVVVGAMALAAG